MLNVSKNRCCCFFGHRNVAPSLQIINNVSSSVTDLIVNHGVDTFLFGSRSSFDQLCHDVVSQLKAKHPHLKRIYVRAEYPFISNSYKDHLLQFYEDTYFPNKILNAGKASYIERNQEMIDNSAFCIIFYNENISKKKSGTRVAFNYAKRKNLRIKNVAEMDEKP